MLRVTRESGLQVTLQFRTRIVVVGGVAAAPGMRYRHGNFECISTVRKEILTSKNLTNSALQRFDELKVDELLVLAC